VPKNAVPISVNANSPQAVCLTAFSSGFSREKPGFSSYTGEYQRLNGLAIDPLSGFEYVNNLSLFPKPYSAIHIIDERHVVAATEPMDAMPGNFVNLKLVMQPQVLSNFNEEDLHW
jgi:hypothetical protein